MYVTLKVNSVDDKEVLHVKEWELEDECWDHVFFLWVKYITFMDVLLLKIDEKYHYITKSAMTALSSRN